MAPCSGAVDLSVVGSRSPVMRFVCAGYLRVVQDPTQEARCEKQTECRLTWLRVRHPTKRGMVCTILQARKIHLLRANYSSTSSSGQNRSSVPRHRCQETCQAGKDKTCAVKGCGAGCSSLNPSNSGSNKARPGKVPGC